MPLVFKAVAALAAIWLVTGLIMWQTGEREVSLESLGAWMEQNPLTELEDESAREKRIRQMADRYNRLGPEERRRLRDRDGEGPPPFVGEMTDEERRLFVDLTISESFNQMMKAFNEMEPEERQKMVERAMKQIREDDTMTPARLAELEDSEREMVERVTNEGLRAYYEEASADTKIDLAPVFDQIQKNLKTPAYHRK